MKAYRDGGITPLTLNLDTIHRWLVHSCDSYKVFLCTIEKLQLYNTREIILPAERKEIYSGSARSEWTFCIWNRTGFRILNEAFLATLDRDIGCIRPKCNGIPRWKKHMSKCALKLALGHAQKKKMLAWSRNSAFVCANRYIVTVRMWTSSGKWLVMPRSYESATLVFHKLLFR